MTIRATYSCDGCFTKIEGTTWFQRKFISATGKPYGLGTYTYSSVQDLTPTGWVDFDPFTGCCYCPECWKSIEGEEQNANNR